MKSETRHTDNESGPQGVEQGVECAAGEPSRRRFLRSAVAGASLAGALPVVASALSGGAVFSGKSTDAADDRAQQRGDGEHDPLEQVLQRYGSELGGITRIG